MSLNPSGKELERVFQERLRQEQLRQKDMHKRLTKKNKVDTIEKMGGKFGGFPGESGCQGIGRMCIEINFCVT